MHETIDIYHFGNELKVTIATTQDSHSHYSENDKSFLELRQNVKNVLRNIPGVVVK